MTTKKAQQLTHATTDAELRDMAAKQASKRGLDNDRELRMELVAKRDLLRAKRRTHSR